MIWDDARMVATDLETSGRLPEYALQPWRLKRGDAWITSASLIRHVNNSLDPHVSQLFPSRDVIKQMLLDCIANNWVVIGWNIAFDISMLMALGPDIEELCFKVTWVDGMLLWRHLDIEPEYEFATRKHLKKSYSLKGYTDTSGRFFPGAVQEFLPPAWHGLDEDVEFHSTDPAALAKLQRYNDRDNVRAWVITKHIWHKLAPSQLRAALIQAEALPVVAQANLYGLKVDVLTCRHLGAKLMNDAAAYLHALAPEGVTEKIVRSPKQLGDLMFDTWKLPVLKKNKSKVEGKEDSRSTDKEVLHELAFIDPRVKQVKLYRETLNAKGKFVDSVLESVEYNEDGCTHPIAKLFGTYCVPGDVEVLTRQGWAALSDWEGGEIAQVHPDQRIEFLPAGRFVGPLTDDWLRVNHARLACDFTPGHTMPFLQERSGEWATVKAGEMAMARQYALPVAGRISLNGSITADQMRVLAMVQADGSWRRSGAISLCFEKPRKWIRARILLAAAGVKYSEHLSGTRTGRRTIYVRSSDCPPWLTRERKIFGAWVLGTTGDGLRALVEEVEHWDGNPHPDGGVRYASKIRENVEWICTAAALVGLKASLHTKYADGMSGCHISAERAVVSVRPSRHMTEVDNLSRAYCATTKTGFWLARSRGHIFITGNTDRMTVSSKQGKGKEERPIGFALHQMKRGKEFREIITVEEGYDLMEFDAAGQEFRWMAEASGDTTMLNLCMPGEDAHSYMGAAIIGSDYRTLMRLVHEEDKAAGQNRYLGKFANLSLQYRTSAKKLRVKARTDYDIPLELPEAQRIHATYQRTYPGVPVYWDQQIALVKAQGYVETFAGTRVRVEGDWNGGWGWSMGSTAINTRIQGTGAEQKHLAIAAIKHPLNQAGGRLLFDLHDGLYVAIPSDKALDVGRKIKHILDNLPYQQAWGFTPSIPMPWDCKHGKAWGRLKEVNFEK